MSVLKDKEGKVHVCFSDRDLLDIVEEKCGDDIRREFEDKLKIADDIEAKNNKIDDLEYDIEDLQCQVNSVETDNLELKDAIEEIQDLAESKKRISANDLKDKIIKIIENCHAY